MFDRSRLTDHEERRHGGLLVLRPTPTDGFPRVHSGVERVRVHFPTTSGPGVESTLEMEHTFAQDEVERHEDKVIWHEVVL